MILVSINSQVPSLWINNALLVAIINDLYNAWLNLPCKIMFYIHLVIIIMQDLKTRGGRADTKRRDIVKPAYCGQSKIRTPL